MKLVEPANVIVQLLRTLTFTIKLSRSVSSRITWMQLGVNRCDKIGISTSIFKKHAQLLNIQI